MVKAVAHCHKNNVIHRDIKLENFLVSSDEFGEPNIKLADFGMSCIYDTNDPPTMKCGSL